MKVMTVFGTRPEAIKMAPVVQSLLAHPEIETKVCLTAQHREMLDQVVDLFKLPVDYDLDIMRSGQSLYDITSRVLRGLEEVLEKEIIFGAKKGIEKLEAVKNNFFGKFKDFIKKAQEINNPYIPDDIEKFTEDLY